MKYKWDTVHVKDSRSVHIKCMFCLIFHVLFSKSRFVFMISVEVVFVSGEVTPIHHKSLWETLRKRARLLHRDVASTLLFLDVLCDTLLLDWT